MRAFHATFASASPAGALWLEHARELLRVHLEAPSLWGAAQKVTLDTPVLRQALDEALRPRQDLVERKRVQLQEFKRLGPAVG